jgi:sensor histidine kinase regulating citrate/malate metabolism
MRLVTKITIFFGIIVIILMTSVFMFTQYFFQKELEAQVENSLRVTYESFKLTIANIVREQQSKSSTQTRRDIISLATKDRLEAILHYYLKLAANDYNLNLIEVLDPGGRLLADNLRSYEAKLIRIPFPKFVPVSDQSYLSRRGPKIYLITTTPVVFDGKLVGYLNVGTLLDRDLVNYFSSVLHVQLLFFADTRYLIGNATPMNLPDSIRSGLARDPDRALFLPGSKLHITSADFIFARIQGDDSFGGIVALVKDRTEVRAALLRMNLSLWLIVGFGLVFGFIGANQLARNIKKSIFGMEPHEIASLLDQRTTILQSTFEGIIALNQEGVITLINKEAERLLANTPDIVGQPVQNFFRGPEITELFSSGQAVFNRYQVIGEMVVVYNMVPIKRKHLVVGAVITMRDLTEFQKVAEELMEVKNYTQALRAQSHEFMNKLQSVSGLIQLGNYETALTLLHEATESHQDLISFLAQAFSTSAVSGILLGKFNRAKELNIHFEIKRGSYIPKDMIFPDHELVCIVGNLIENALEALQESAQPEKDVSIKIHPSSKFLRIIICDNGPGIPAAIRQKIFERGFTTKKGLNKGNGLSLVRQSVENLKGKIGLRCGKNTTFLVKIPLKNGGPN